MPALPRRFGIERGVEQFLDPCRKQILRRAAPRIAYRPDAARRRTWPRRLLGAYGYFARDGATFTSNAIACERRAPGANGGVGDLGDPEIGRPAVAPGRFCSDAAIRRDQRKLANHWPLRRKQDPEPCPLPRSQRPRQKPDTRRVFAN